MTELRTATRAWAKGNVVIDPPSELSLFILCDRFGVLPESGGIYDQNPYILRAFSVIMNIISEEENKKYKKKK